MSSCLVIDKIMQSVLQNPVSSQFVLKHITEAVFKRFDSTNTVYMKILLFLHNY